MLCERAHVVVSLVVLHRPQNDRGPRGDGNRHDRGDRKRGGGMGFNKNRGGFGRPGRGGGRGGHQPPSLFASGGGNNMPDKKGPPGMGHFNKPQDDDSLMQPEQSSVPLSQKKFTGRCRLFVGNLPADMTEDEFKEMFSPHGEFTEVFLNPSKSFGFIRMVCSLIIYLLVRLH